MTVEKPGFSHLSASNIPPLPPSLWQRIWNAVSWFFTGGLFRRTSSNTPLDPTRVTLSPQPHGIPNRGNTCFLASMVHMLESHPALFANLIALGQQQPDNSGLRIVSDYLLAYKNNRPTADIRQLRLACQLLASPYGKTPAEIQEAYASVTKLADEIDRNYPTFLTDEHPLPKTPKEEQQVDIYWAIKAKNSPQIAAIAKNFPLLDGQHDPAEALDLILRAATEVSPASEKHLFPIIVKKTTHQCPEGYIPPDDLPLEPRSFLQLSITAISAESTGIQEALACYTSSEGKKEPTSERNCVSLTNGEISSQPVTPSTKYATETPPPYIFVQIQRSSDGIEKDLTSISLSDSISIFGAEYELNGCIFHSADSSKSGHYTAAVKTKKDEYLFLNDAKSEKISRETLQAQENGVPRPENESPTSRVSMLSYRIKKRS